MLYLAGVRTLQIEDEVIMTLSPAYYSAMFDVAEASGIVETISSLLPLYLMGGNLQGL